MPCAKSFGKNSSPTAPEDAPHVADLTHLSNGLAVLSNGSRCSRVYSLVSSIVEFRSGEDQSQLELLGSPDVSAAGRPGPVAGATPIPSAQDALTKQNLPDPRLQKHRPPNLQAGEHD